MRLTRKEYEQALRTSAKVACERANDFLKPLNVTLEIDWGYDRWERNGLGGAIGVYVRGSVFDKVIRIGFNLENLYRYLAKETKRWPNTNPYRIIDETAQTNVFHEMGHGIFELIDSNPDFEDPDFLYETVYDDEEEYVEEFAWDFYDNMVEDTTLYRLIQLYLKAN